MTFYGDKIFYLIAGLITNDLLIRLEIYRKYGEFMRLREFIKEILSQSVDGVHVAQQLNGGAFVVPAGDGGHKYAEHARFVANALLKSTIVDFDLAITAEESDKVERGDWCKSMLSTFWGKGGDYLQRYNGK